MAQKTSQKTALVTGCSSGIGYCVAKELAKRGWKVFACARRLQPMQSLVEEYPDRIEIFSMDVSSVDSIEKGYQFVVSHLEDDKLDLLYNNAGSSCTFPAIDVPDEALTQCLAVNVEGPIRLTHKFSKLIINAQGTIAFTGSLAGVLPFPWGSVYGASKSAIHQYASILAFELEPFNVHVLNFVTGGVKTNIADKRPLPEDSIYNLPETRKSFADRQQMAVKNHPMEPSLYAIKAVNAIERRRMRTVNVYLGTGALPLTWVSWLVPRSFLLFCLRIKFGLNTVWEAIRHRKIL
ncbi:DEKNAAC103030 [Brettanomyces naardenensis]|uniref:DEKNAAC103030 n=1 Tax=Brettanomyces naardenensis TaxID=13370 RepID=A0A448YMC7_BRENA|nr:DEKNAAC103030 [Brettanomyces naardenensis]